MFDESGVARDPAGVKRYRDLPGSVVELLRATVDRYPAREAVVELDGPRVTYGELWDRSARVAGGLRSAGVRPGDRVTIRYGNGLDWVLAFFGTLMAGAVAVPVNTRLVESEVAHVVADSQASLVLGPLPDGAPYCVSGLDRGDPAAIFYTSGTTGLPKGAVVTHENFLTNAENGLRVSELPRDDPELRNLVSVPLFHVAACNSQLIPMVQIGATTVVMPAFEVHRFLRAVPEERIRVVSTAPAIYWHALHHPRLADVDLSGVECATYGGAPMAPSLVRLIKQGFPKARVGNGFGLTETASLATFLPDAWAVSHADSVGWPAPTVDVSLSATGELLVRGGNVVPGYWRDPTATAAAFQDGWLRTGDVARIDDEGRVYVVDRIKDMINRGGENVYSVEVENVLAGAPGVFDGGVEAVPDPMMGEKVGAVVVPFPGALVDSGTVLAYARERLADFKVPQYLRVQPEPLPRNAGGKVRKALLRERGGWEAVR
ncbi:MAG: acyl-CoA dehydrogenase [Actinobacteria bacterium 13_1_20CM_3_71_11]|nr:MAG: acyl-CoA dehydrogenase [Actinobacteria bacterium 13_1_20CM_3_71_11]